MRMIIFTIATMLGGAAAGWSQAYYEASGQTQAFTLAAGAKAGPSAIKRGSDVRSGPHYGLRVIFSRGGIVVTLPGMHRGSADIALYNIKGRQVYRQIKNGPSLRLETPLLAPGIYNMLIRFDGLIYSHRIAVSGREE